MLVSAFEAHRIWAESYDAAPNPLLALERRVLRDLLRAATAMRVVDVACGTGHWAAWFQQRGASVWGIDASKEMLTGVPARLRGRVALGRAEDLPVACDAADLTLCSLAAGYFSGLERAIAEMARITRSGGVVVIADLHPAAVAAGWTRSFRAAGRVYELEHCRYSLADFTGASRPNCTAILASRKGSSSRWREGRRGLRRWPTFPLSGLEAGVKHDPQRSDSGVQRC
jgi:SAM-dependent methyltransferase